MKNPILKDEAIYEEEKRERWLFEQRRAHGISRRQLIRMFAAGAGAAALGIVPTFTPRARANHAVTVKPTPTSLFIDHGTNFETRFEAFATTGYVTPNELFFVRNHSATPHVDASTWRMRLYGSGVRREVSVSYEDILKLPAYTETKFIECAGNGRSQFLAAHGKRAAGTQWRLGAIGVAEWRGARLSDVLELAGIRRNAVDVMAVGLDTQRVRRPMSIEKAVEDDTLVVYEMNGVPLPPDHGYPVRLLVPGWGGIQSCKWVGEIEVSETPLFSDWNTKTYRMFGDAYPDRPLVTTQVVKSAFELPWAGSIPAGPRVVTGRAWSGAGAIDHVEVSFDGATWQHATLDQRNVPKAWARWSLPWSPTPGSYTIRARATDSRGNTQPSSVPFNDQGYLFGAVVDHPITVV